jgi:GT2 family glycosyltransferase/glycosyltransferase involved in cell wall biosynthesis
MKNVDVVIPVYDGFQETLVCLESALKTIDGAWARIIVVNDCSPDPGITNYLRQLAADNAQLVLLENDTNLGFVEAANRGMAHDTSRDVLLLNSDVEVAGNWLQRMRDAAYLNDSVGSVTPFSNNATLCSFPNICKENELLFGLSCAQIDAQFAENFNATDVVDLPTGIGFCMYIQRECLDKVGLFDAQTFGRGYGEENDWCQRALAGGWRNVLIANCFVYHKGGVSFQEEQDSRIENAMQLLDKRYPTYHRNIQDVIVNDPAKGYRIQSLLGIFARQEKPKIVTISHKLGGGAQQHIDELATLYNEQALFLQITPEEEGRSVRLEIFEQGSRLQDGLYFDVNREYDKLVQLLIALGVGRVHFHHTMGLNPRLWVLATDLGCDYDLTLHDYHLVNGNPTLTDAEARYVPDSAADFDARCAEHYPLPPGISAEEWRQNQCLLVENASRVILPSEDCRRRFAEFYRLQRSCVAWHPDYFLSKPYPAPTWKYRGDRPLKVLVLGAISREKGADVLEQVASLMKGEQVEFHLLGYAYRALPPPIITHGPYDNADVYELVEEIIPDVVWFPALWPETYSYTLSVALHLGLPVVVPNIGAFSERVEGRALSVVQPWDNTREQWQEFWRSVIHNAKLPAIFAEPSSDVGENRMTDNFYQKEYLSPVRPRCGAFSSELRSSIVENYSVSLPTLSRSERVLAWIWRLSRTAFVSKIVSLVPFRAQRALKRRLSSRPMHDIVRNQ